MHRNVETWCVHAWEAAETQAGSVHGAPGLGDVRACRTGKEDGLKERKQAGGPVGKAG